MEFLAGTAAGETWLTHVDNLVDIDEDKTYIKVLAVVLPGEVSEVACGGN